MVVGATEGDKAIRLALDLRPRLVLLDIMMPKLDGWEVCRRMRSFPTLVNTPIIVCSVLQQAQMALALGADAYLSKPVSQPDILRVLRQHLGPLPQLSS